jgi:hypothetical protein
MRFSISVLFVVLSMALAFQVVKIFSVYLQKALLETEPLTLWHKKEM